MPGWTRPGPPQPRSSCRRPRRAGCSPPGYPIRRTDVTPGGRLRFDALARYLQDVAEDDVTDSGLAEPYDWLVRRCALTIRGYPRRGQRLRLATFCSATGPRWAERTTTVTAGGTDLVQARMVWVAVDPVTGESCQVGPDFHRLYGAAAQGRRVSVRLSHPAARPGGRRPGTGRCGPATSTPPRTSATPCTGRPRRRCSPGWTGCPPAPRWNTTTRYCPAPGCGLPASSPRAALTFGC